MKYLAIALAFFICGAVASEGSFEDQLNPNEKLEAAMVKNFSHYLIESGGLEETCHSGLSEILDIVGVAESDDLDFGDGRRNKSRKFNCKGNKCTLTFRVRRFRRITVRITIVYSGSNLTLSVTSGKKVVLKGTTSARRPTPICRKGKCPMFGPFCGVFTNMKKTSKGYTGCLQGQATIFKKKVMKRQVGCFTLTSKSDINPVPILESQPEDDESKADNFRMKMFKKVFNRLKGLKEQQNKGWEYFPEL